MNRLHIILASLTFAVFLTGAGFNSFGDEVEITQLDCSSPLRNSYICYGMRNLRSQIIMLNAQRDLMQFNFGFLEAIGDNVDQLTSSLMTHPSGAHLGGLNGVRQTALNMKQQALDKNPQAFSTANKIQTQCLACHANQDPYSGIPWSKVAGKNWNNLVEECNATSTDSDIPDGVINERVPYRCKSMYGMLSIIQYYLTLIPIGGNYNYKTIGQTALELKRIAADIEAKNLVHHGTIAGYFTNIQNKADQIYRESEIESIAAMNTMRSVAAECMQCHSQGGAN